MRRLLLSTRDCKGTKVLVAKAWRQFTKWKYLAVIILFWLSFVWGAWPALQPGVTGFKGYSDFLIGRRRTHRIELNYIREANKIKPDWCIYDEEFGLSSNMRSSWCGVMLDGKKTLYSLKPMNNRWNGTETIYQYGTRQSMNLGAKGVDLVRDWEWLNFFYGYDAISSIGGTAIRLQSFPSNFALIALFLLFLSVVIDFTTAGSSNK